MMYKHTISGEIIDEEYYEELLDEETQSWLDEFYFERWLDDNYSAHEIFNMCDMERQELYELFYDDMREYAINQMDYELIEEEEEE